MVVSFPVHYSIVLDAPCITNLISFNVFFNFVGFRELRFISMMSVPSPLLDKVPDVEIDPEGRFKYVLIRVYAPATKDGNEPSKMVVRGNARGAYHGECY